MKLLKFALLASVGVLSLASMAHAATIYAIDDSSNQTLISFDSAAPGNLLNAYAISGLQGNETIKGIDFRPSNNQLYALGSTNRLYTLDMTSGAATQVGAGPFAPVLNGSNFGFDFNPAIDKIRVVSNTRKNYVLDPDTGTATGVTDLFYGPGDANDGAFPNVEFSAYTNSVSPAPNSTQLYGIDTGLDILVTQANSAGTLGTVGALGGGLDVGAVGGFDIAFGNNTAFAAMLPVGTSASSLYSIDLSTGAATLVGGIDGGAVISSMAINPVPEPASLALLALAGFGLIGRKARS